MKTLSWEARGLTRLRELGLQTPSRSLHSPMVVPSPNPAPCPVFSPAERGDSMVLTLEAGILGSSLRSDLGFGIQGPETTAMCPGWCLAPRAFQQGQRCGPCSRGNCQPAVGGRVASAFQGPAVAPLCVSSFWASADTRSGCRERTARAQLCETGPSDAQKCC